MVDTRRLICTTLGHVDHGKSSILDKIRGTAIVKGEAGAITQAIGASIIPLDLIKKICGDLLKSLKTKFTIPGLLFIDTPGHAAFTNLRRRGGNLADMAILVIDINEGLKPQTLECIEILKNYKTPFVIAANKIDIISGWQVKEGFLLEKIKQQSENIQGILDKRLYELVGKLAELGFESERFDRIDDPAKQITIIPTSAKTGAGIPELLMVLVGLAQRYLEKGLKFNIKGPAKGTILEVKEEKGLGKCLDVIIYDGTLKEKDTIVIGSLNEPIVTKIRSLCEPAPLSEMRDKKSKFKTVKQVTAAMGVRITAPEIEEVVAGMPILATTDANLEKTKEEVQKEIKEVIIETDKEGIVIKADTLGSLEALIKLLKEKEISIKKASIGGITKKDLADAEANYEKDPLQSVVLGFNIKDESGICKDTVKVITNDVIYKLIEDFEKWQQGEKKRQEGEKLKALVRPCKIQILKGYVFRQSNPAICGVDVLAGTLKVGVPLMKEDGKEITEVKAIQLDKENVNKIERNKQGAVSMEGVTIGRQINEGTVLYSAVPEDHFRKLKELKTYLSEEEKGILREIGKIMREDNPVWGV